MTRPTARRTTLPEQQALLGLPELLRSLPFARTLVTVATPRSLPELVEWLHAYAVHAGAELATVEERARVDARAATVLRGLRRDIENAADTLAQLDARGESDG